MKTKPIPVEQFYRLINHGPCCLVSSGDSKIKNIAPIVWITPVNDDPPLVGICVASSHYTSKLIKKYKTFVINVPQMHYRNTIVKTGSISGKQIDKFIVYRIPWSHGQKVKTVHVTDVVGFIEARIIFAREFEGVNFFVGKVLHAEAQPSSFKEYLIPHKAKTIHHIGSNKFFPSSKLLSI